MAKVKLVNVKKVYDGNVVAAKDINIDVDDGEFVILVGPSGCGKTTTLRMIAGLEDITEGDIYIGDRRVNDIMPKNRNVAMVFQNYALYPHMSVKDNLSFGLRIKKVDRKEIEERIEWASKILGLDKYLDRKPKQLSGGQRQRVAVGRAIVRKPEVFLFDEPLSNLDAKKRVEMRSELLALHNKLKVTMIYVTHDQVEAMTMGDKIVVLESGAIQQISSPLELYRNPNNKFVAGFIGTPPMNFIEGELVRESGKWHFKSESVNVDVSKAAKDLKPMKCTLGIRPEDIIDVDVEKGKNVSETRKTVLNIVEPLGNDAIVHFRYGNEELKAVVEMSDKYKYQAELKFAFDLDKLYLFAENGDRL